MAIKYLLQKWRAWRYNRLIAQRNFGAKSVAEIFQETYLKRYWKNPESVSGGGATLEQTAVLRAALPDLLRQWRITSLLDLPCGDFNWMQHVDLQGIHYTGADIVSDLVAQNQARFGNTQRRFLHLDLLQDPLPEADALLLRDCLVHFSFAHIRQALANIQKSRIRYLLTTSFTRVTENTDIQTGFWRPLNLQMAPFHFPEPLFCLEEKCTENNGAFADKSLCVWETASLPAISLPT